MSSGWAVANASPEFARRVERRLAEARVAWYTSAGRDGTPQPNPVWFIVEAGELLVYNRPSAGRVRHAAGGGRAAVHLDGDGRGGDIVVLTGAARLSPDDPPPHLHAAYMEKYESAMARVSGSPEAFSAAYPVAIRFRPERVRGH